MILPDVHVVKLSGVSGLYLDLLGNFAAGVDPVALESAEDAIEAALLDPEPALQGLNHLPMCMRIFKVHIERRRVSSANSIKTSFTAPQLYAALVVRVENPHVILSQRLWMEPVLPEAMLLRAERISTRRGGGECEELI